MPVFSFTGLFPGDDSIEFFAIDVISPGSSVQVQTYGFGGGTNGNLAVISPGGFASDLSLFDPSGNQNAVGNNNACPPANTSGGNCFDSFLSLDGLDPGLYFLALTVDSNFPLDGVLADGFTHAPGSGNYTCDAFGGPAGGAFCDVTAAQDDGHWALDVTGTGIQSVTDVSETTPEPAPVLLLLSGAGALLFLRRSRLISTRPE